MNTNNPRAITRQEIIGSLPSEEWKQNGEYVSTLRAAVVQHRIMKHPIIPQLQQGQYAIEDQRKFHLEFRHAFAQIFTDALIQAMVTCAQVEHRAGAIGKVSSRFLLQLNVLDELGFVSNSDASSDYAGNPRLSHYVQFDETLRQLDLSPADVAAHQPSELASACRATFLSRYTDHTSLTAILATSETVFSAFSAPWASSVSNATDIDVSVGYHSIHVEHDGKFIDDDHSEDAWYVFQQAITPDRYDEILSSILGSLDTWSAFLDRWVV